MVLHKTTFQYLRPTEAQLGQMEAARTAASAYAIELEAILPDGPDKTYVLRKLREVAMWANIAITRNPDGSPKA